MPLASLSAAEAPRRPNFGFTAPPSCSHRTSAWLTNRPASRPGEHDAMDAGVAVDTVDEHVEFVSGVEAEQAMRPAVDAYDQNRAAVLDVEVLVVLVCHGCGFRGAWLEV